MNFIEFEIVEFIPHKLEHKASFYSIKLKGEAKSEAEKFFEEFEQTESDKIENISNRIQIMFLKRGCVESQFKLKESSIYNNVCAMWEGDMRLYCLRYGKVAVILGGGAIKEEEVKTYQDSEVLDKHVKLLENVFQQIERRIIVDKQLRVLDNKLEGNFKFYIEE